MPDTPQQTDGRDACRIAIHTAPDLCELRFQQMQALINGSLTDAFLPPLPDLFATLDDATLSNPYWQSEYRELAQAEIIKHCAGLLPIANQLQMDSATFVSCLKVKEPIEFQQVLHFETESNRWHRRTQQGFLQDCDPSELFFGLVSEKHQPDMRTWHDIPWDTLGVVPKETFYRFIKILLWRLEGRVFEIWESGAGFCLASGYDQEIVEGTYFDLIREQSEETNS